MDLAKECQLVSLATSFAQGGKSKNSITGWKILRLVILKQSIHIVLKISEPTNYLESVPEIMMKQYTSRTTFWQFYLEYILIKLSVKKS